MTAAPFLSGAAPLELALRGTLLLGAAWLAAAALRRAGASAATRHMVWLLGIVALLALPLLWWLLPPLRLPVLRPEVVTAAATSFPVPAATAAPPVPAGGLGWEVALLAAWLLGVTMLLLRYAFCRQLVARLWRAAGPAADPAWQNMLASVQRELRLSRPVALRIACGPAMPMTWGTLAPKVLLPAEACAWSPDRRRLVLLHELAHVARRDSLGRSASSLACALYWFHPGVWLAARRLRLEQEYAADDRVLSAGAAPRSYAASLLDLARRVGETSRPDHAAAMAGMCQLERRLVSITTLAPRARPGPAFQSAAALVALAVTLAVAVGVLVRPLTELPEPLLAPGPHATPTDPAPAEATSRFEAAAANPAPGGGRVANLRDVIQEHSSAPPPAQADASAVEAGPSSVPLMTAAPVNIPPPARQLGPIGPQLPQRLAEERETDPRIPAALRQANAGRGDGQTQPGAAARSRRSGIMRFLPRLVPAPSGALQ